MQQIDFDNIGIKNYPPPLSLFTAKLTFPTLHLEAQQAKTTDKTRPTEDRRIR